MCRGAWTSLSPYEYYILLGLPNFFFSSEQREVLERALIALVAGVEDGYREVFRLCEEIRRVDGDI